MALKAHLVVPEGDGCPETYIQLGSWKTHPNHAAADVQALKDAADQAGTDPSRDNVEGVLAQVGRTAEGATWAETNGAALREQVDQRDRRQGARAQALNAYDQQKRAYDPLAQAATAAYQALGRAKAAYEAAVAASAAPAELRTLKRAYDAAKTDFDAKEKAHDAARDRLTDAEATLLKAQADYQASKAQLGSLLAQAFAVGMQATVDRARLNPTERKRGDDLAARIVDFYDDTRSRGPFTDLSVAERKAETKLLHTKGGWRDHTEGNRISTTRGDKLEVIRGNYRRLVMGRQDATGNGALLDASGGIYRDADFTPGSVVLVEYSQIWDGDTWLSKEEASKGNVESYYHGNVKEVFYGEKVESYVGEQGGSWDGASTKKPMVIEKAWVKSVEAETHVSEGVKETTKVSGDITESTEAANIRETTTAHTSIHSTTKVGAGIVDMTHVGAGVVEISTIGASHVEIEAATTHITMELSPATLDLFVGAIRFEGNIVGAVYTVNMGKRFDVDVAGGIKVTPSDAEMKGVKKDLAATSTTVEANKTSLAATKTALEANTTKIGAMSKEITAMDKRISGMHSLL